MQILNNDVCSLCQKDIYHHSNFRSTDTTYNEIHEYYRGHIQRTNNVDRYAAWKQDISEEQQAKINLFNSKITLHNHETLRRRRINA